MRDDWCHIPARHHPPGTAVVRDSADTGGHTPRRQAPGHSFNHVADLLAVMDALDVGSAVLVGNSQGERISLDVALDHPERVDGLVLVGPAITGAPYPFGFDADPAEEASDEATDAADDPVEANRLEAHLRLDGPLQAGGRVGGASRELFLDMNGIARAAADTGEVSWARQAGRGSPTSACRPRS